MASCSSAAQRWLCPPVAQQPSGGYRLLWLCSPAQAIVSRASAAQRRLWPPVALQPSAGYDLLWLCSSAQAMASSFTRFRDHTKRRATVSRTPFGRVISSSQRPVPDKTQHIQQTNIHAPRGIRTYDRSRWEAVDLRLKLRDHWDWPLDLPTCPKFLKAKSGVVYKIDHG
jgi:hypothetical protein